MTRAWLDAAWSSWASLDPRVNYSTEKSAHIKEFNTKRPSGPWSRFKETTHYTKSNPEISFLRIHSQNHSLSLWSYDHQRGISRWQVDRGGSEKRDKTKKMENVFQVCGPSDKLLLHLPPVRYCLLRLLRVLWLWLHEAASCGKRKTDDLLQKMPLMPNTRTGPQLVGSVL